MMNLFDRSKQLGDAHMRIAASLLQLDALLRSGIPIEPSTFTSCYAHIAAYLTHLGELQQEVTQLQQSQPPSPDTQE